MTRPVLTLSYPHPGTPLKYKVENGGGIFAPGTYLEAATVGAFGTAYEVWIKARKETE